MKILKLIVLALVLAPILTGCAAHRAKKELIKEVDVVLRNAAVTGEPCNIVCGKLKAVYSRYKSRLN